MARVDLLSVLGSLFTRTMPGNGVVAMFSFAGCGLRAPGFWMGERFFVGFAPTNQMCNLPTMEADRLHLFGDRWNLLNPDPTATATAVVVATETENQQKVR